MNASQHDSDPAEIPCVPLSLFAADGYALAAHCWTPHGKARAIVVVNPATAVAATYYHRYARFLAAHGFAVLTYDYRGIGASRPQDLRAHRTITKLDWGRFDCDAALAWARQRFPNIPLHVVAHSIGGLLVGLANANRHVSRCLTVGAQYAYWRDYAPRSRLVMLLRWHVVMPVLTAVFGYFPARALGWHEDLPAGTAYEWAFRRARLEASWRGKLALAGDPLAHFEGMRGDILAVGMSDDPFATPSAVNRLLAYFPRARRIHQRISPASLGEKNVGHFAFFHDRFRDSLWRDSLRWLENGEVAGEYVVFEKTVGTAETGSA